MLIRHGINAAILLCKAGDIIRTHGFVKTGESEITTLQLESFLYQSAYLYENSSHLSLFTTFVANSSNRPIDLTQYSITDLR